MQHRPDLHPSGREVAPVEMNVAGLMAAIRKAIDLEDAAGPGLRTGERPDMIRFSGRSLLKRRHAPRRTFLSASVAEDP